MKTNRSVNEPKETMSEKLPEIEVVLKKLTGLSDELFGKYAFHCEPLNGKLGEESRRQLISKANECGKEYARRLIRQFGHILSSACASKLGINIRSQNEPEGGSHIVFAQFCEPNEILLSQYCIDKATLLIKEKNLVTLLGNLDVENVLIAHEIFHYLEMTNKKEIFTKTEKIELWSVGPIHNRSNILCLSEIAGMAFAKELTNLPYSPYVLDALFMYVYNPEAANTLFTESHIT
jgi:hypothetical protein